MSSGGWSRSRPDGGSRWSVVLLVVATVVVIALAGYSMRSTPAPATTGGSVVPTSSASASSKQYDTVFMGDSTTQANTPSFDGGSGNLSWVSTVTPDPKSPWLELANVAVGGNTTADMLARFKKDVVKRKPEAVVILAGTNDAGQNVPTSESMDHLTQMVEMSRAAKAKVWLISPPPNSNYPEAQAAFADAEKALADELDVPFIDIRGPLADETGAWRSRKLTEDGTHPTYAGSAAMAKAVLAGL